MLMIALRLILKDKGGKQHGLIPFVGSIMGVEIFLQKREHQRGMRWNRGLRFQGNSMQRLSAFQLFFRYKRNSNFVSVPWLLNFSDLPNYGLNSRKRYTLRLLSKCLVRSTLLPIGGKVPPTLWYPLWFL